MQCYCSFCYCRYVDSVQRAMGLDTALHVAESKKYSFYNSREWSREPWLIVRLNSSKGTRCSGNIPALKSNNHRLEIQLCLFQLHDFEKWLNFKWNSVLALNTATVNVVAMFCFWIPKGLNNALKMIAFVNIFWLIFILMIKLAHR